MIFTDVTASTGITFSHVFSPDKKYIVESMSGGVALFDFDKDGWIDIYLVNSPTVATAANPGGARSALWRNNRNGTFIDVTERAGVGAPGWAMGVATGDYDNDGWEDLYVTCFGANRLYRNNGDGTFTDVTARAGVGDSRWSAGAAFGDYDNDGRLDLFVANYIDLRLDALPEFGSGKNCLFRGLAVQCGPRGLKGAGDSLYRNNGDGTFTDVSTAAGVADPALRFGMGVAWCDFNEDGHIDLYVANDSGPNFLYKNNGNGTFTDVGLASGTAVSENGADQASMGVAIGDYDHRGRWNIIVTNFSDEYNAVYRHEKDFSVHRRVICDAHRQGEPALRRLGGQVLRLRQRRLAGSDGGQRTRLSATGAGGFGRHVSPAQALVPQRSQWDLHGGRAGPWAGLDRARRGPRRRLRGPRQRWRHRCRRQQPGRTIDGASQRRRSYRTTSW